MEKELIEFIAKKLVDSPDQVDVKMVEGEKSIVIELRTAPEDIGKVIGKQAHCKIYPHITFSCFCKIRQACNIGDY